MAERNDRKVVAKISDRQKRMTERSGRKEWQGGVAGRSGRKEWHNGVTGKSIKAGDRKE